MVVETQEGVGNREVRPLLADVVQTGLVLVGHMYFRIEVLGGDAQGE